MRDDHDNGALCRAFGILRIGDWRGNGFHVLLQPAMTVIRRSVAVAILVCLGSWCAVCAPVKTVRVEDVHVTPVTSADLQKAIHDPSAKAVLVNMWATWCGPCRAEFPGLVEVAHKYQGQGLKVLLVSADVATDLPAVKKFLAERGVEFPAYLKAEKDEEFIDGIGKQWSGALPATFIFDGTGKLRDFWEGEATFNVFEQKVVEALGKPIKPTGGTP
jgi:thiol-disulfide isomerase/thioredoxin